MVETMSRHRIDAVFRTQAPRMWRALLASTGDREVASDAVAEAFAQVLRRGDAVRDPERWVWKAAYRIAAGAMSDRSRTTPLVGSTDPDG